MGCSRISLRLGLAILTAALAGWGCVSLRGQADAQQVSPQNDPSNQHTITVTFDYDFQRNPSCEEQPKLKTCVNQFVVYDASGGKVRLFSIPVPEGSRGLVKGIKGQSPRRIFLPGKHLIAVAAQNADGVETQINAASQVVDVKTKTARQREQQQEQTPAKREQ